MTDTSVHPVPRAWCSSGIIDARVHESEYRRSIYEPLSFWRERTRLLDWITPPTAIRNVSYGPQEVSIRWFEDGVLNAAYNCIDRHLPARREQVALLWEGDDAAQTASITYGKLFDCVARLANALKASGVRRGDRVAIYLPMVPEAVYSMLACARIGAGGYQFTGYALYDPLVAWEMDIAERPGKLVPGLATEWKVDANTVALMPRSAKPRQMRQKPAREPYSNIDSTLG